MRVSLLFLAAWLLVESPAVAANAVPAAPAVAAAVEAGDYDALRARGPAVLPQLVALYRASTEPHRRAAVARAFYVLGWESEGAKEAMLADLQTLDEELRLQVQWALGRVSRDPVVVDRLFDRMEHDANDLFRDKAACALANDQVHLDPQARFALAARVVDRLESADVETRSLAIRILGVLTGQAKGYLAIGPPERRAAAVARWRAWLEEYRRSL